jgi:hypothetical protein
MAVSSTPNLFVKFVNQSGLTKSITTDLQVRYKQYLKTGARDLVLRASAYDFSIVQSLLTTTTHNSLSIVEITTDDVSSISSVKRDSYPCKEVPYNEYLYYRNNANLGGVKEASVLHPVYFINTSVASTPKVEVLPLAPTNMSIEAIDYSSIDGVDISAATSIPGCSELIEGLLTRYVAIKIVQDELIYLGKEILTTGSYQDALEKAEQLVDGSVTVNNAQEWIDDEDGEMLQAIMMVAQQETSRATASLQGILEKINLHRERKQDLMRDYYGFFGKSEPEEKKGESK